MLGSTARQLHVYSKLEVRAPITFLGVYWFNCTIFYGRQRVYAVNRYRTGKREYEGPTL